MCKVSIIVPVYNTEKYLRDCLESLAVQTLDDVKIIVINDGSTDSSLSIAEEYARRYRNFKVYFTENKGGQPCKKLWRGTVPRGLSGFCRQ